MKKVDKRPDAFWVLDKVLNSIYPHRLNCGLQYCMDTRYLNKGFIFYLSGEPPIFIL